MVFTGHTEKHNQLLDFLLLEDLMLRVDKCLVIAFE